MRVSLGMDRHYAGGIYSRLRTGAGTACRSRKETGAALDLVVARQYLLLPAAPAPDLKTAGRLRRFAG